MIVCSNRLTALPSGGTAVFRQKTLLIMNFSKKLFCSKNDSNDAVKYVSVDVDAGDTIRSPWW